MARLASAQQTVRGINADAIAGATLVPVDNLGEDRESSFERSAIASSGDIAPPRFDVPERRVDRVVFRDAAAAGKHIWQHAAIDEECEGLEDLPGISKSARRQRQPGQSDHGVAAPITKPGITRNHGSTVLDFGHRTGDHVEIAGQHQPHHPARRVSEHGVGRDRTVDHAAVMRPAALQCR